MAQTNDSGQVYFSGNQYILNFFTFSIQLKIFFRITF
jgi:hypothetical protein